MTFYPPQTGEGGGDPGLAIQTATATFAGVAASSSAFADLAIEGSRIFIVGALLTQTDGVANSVRVRMFSEGSYSNDEQELFGSGFSGLSYFGNPIYGPAVSSGGSTTKFGLHYVDLDTTGECHMQLDNGDAGEAGSFTVELKYIVLD